MKKQFLGLCALGVSALISNSAEAGRIYDLPKNCKYGKSERFDYEGQELSNGIQSGYNIYNDPNWEYNQEEASDWGNIFKAVVEFVDSYDYLRVESPKFVLQGKSFRAKGNLGTLRFKFYRNSIVEFLKSFMLLPDVYFNLHF